MGLNPTLAAWAVMSVLGVLDCQAAANLSQNVSLVEYTRERRNVVVEGWKWGNTFIHPRDLVINPFTPAPNAMVTMRPPILIVPITPLPRPTQSLFIDTTNVLFQLHITMIMRNNLVNVFGFLLYTLNVRMNLDLYASLMDIYKGLCNKRVHTQEIIFSIPSMAFKNPHDQMLEVFKILVQTAPLYLMGAVNVWKNALAKRVINLDHILRPKGLCLQVDLLENIQNSFVVYLTQRARFQPAVEQLAPVHILANMGTFMGGLFGGFLHGSILLDRKIVAYIMLLTPLYMTIPEVDEAIHYIADILLGPDSEHLEFACRNIDRMSLGDPYMLVKQFLTRILMAENMDPHVRECAEIILPHFITINILSLNPYYNVMTPYFVHGKLDMQLVLSSICIGEYPEDIVKAKDMLLMAIKVLEININEVLIGFVKHNYVTPHQLLFAILVRIQKRAKIPPYLVEPLHALVIHVKMKYASMNSSPRPLTSFRDFKILLESFFTPQMPASYKQMILTLITKLTQKKIEWKEIFLKFDPRENTRPRQFARQVLLYLMSMNVITEQQLVIFVTDFITTTSPSGDPKDCPFPKCEDNHIQQPSTMATLPPPLIIQTTTPAPPPEKRHCTDLDIAQLFNCISVEVVDIPDLIILQVYIKDTISQYSIDIDVSQYTTTGDLLKEIFNRYLVIAQVRENMKIMELLRKYIIKIQVNGMGARPVEYITKKVIRVVDVNKALLALDEEAITSNGKMPDLEALYNFLAGDYKLINYLERFQYESYTKRGEFIAAIFDHLIKFPNNPSESVKNSLKTLLGYVRQDGPGGEPLDYSESTFTSVETSDI